MPTFRAYLLDRAGKITWGEWIEAEDLAQAKSMAGDLCRAGVPTVEIWEGPRRVAELECEPKT